MNNTMKKTRSTKPAARIIVLIMFCVMFGMVFCRQADAAGNNSLKLKVTDASAKSVSVSWNNCGAKTYYVYMSKDGKNYKAVKKYGSNSKSLKFKAKKLSEKKNYFFKIEGTMVDGNKISSNICKKVKVRGNYRKGTSWGKWLNRKQRAFVKNKVAQIVNCKINQQNDTFHKVKMINDWMRSRTSYSEQGKNYYNAYGLLHNKKASCWGFASAFKAICDGAGIKSHIVYANKKAFNPYHAWNMVKVGKKWYVIDTQINIGTFDEIEYYGSFLIGKENENYGFYAYYKNKKKLPKVSKTGWSYTVTFKGMNGKKWVKRVHCGEDAEPPESAEDDPNEDYYFDHWDKSYKNIWSDKVINAVYERY